MLFGPTVMLFEPTLRSVASAQQVEKERPPSLDIATRISRILTVSVSATTNFAITTAPICSTDASEITGAADTAFTTAMVPPDTGRLPFD